MAAVGRVDNVVVLSGDLFDAIEVNAARTGNHKRAAVRMSRLAAQAQATPSGISRAEAHMRAGEQWLLAAGPAEAVDPVEEATAGVHAILSSGEDREQLQLLPRLRYRLRVDLGMPEHDYDKMLDKKAGPAAGR